MSVKTLHLKNYVAALHSISVVNLLILSCICSHKVEAATKARKLLSWFRCTYTLGIIASMLSSFRRNSSFNNIRRRVYNTDQMLVYLKQPLNYKILTVFLVTQYITMLVSGSLSFTLTLLEVIHQSTWYVLSRSFLECYHLIFDFLVTIQFNFFSFLFIFRFKNLENLLKNIQQDECRSSLKLLLTASRMYGDIFYGVEILNEMNSFPLLVLTSQRTLNLLVVVTMIYNGEQNRTDYLIISVIMLNTLLIILPVYLFTKLGEKFCNILGECNNCYTDLEMSSAKNSFLLQLCHQKIKWSIYNIFPLTVDCISDIVTFGITIVIFLFKLENI
ncbi:hypothetical protein NQ315_009626 [Exocentrus adspersus]|uniref:Gustatory receptor n=1 Tax=Exocentrus adspersus TaxID=1586481 RepID=A0AAV8WHR2_9CUCU|nr:hypothetical protein NQ315_009626 [Exocentrus adspersus]